MTEPVNVERTDEPMTNEQRCDATEPGSLKWAYGNRCVKVVGHMDEHVDSFGDDWPSTPSYQLPGEQNNA